MKIVGLTGNIGSGKSTVAMIFQAQGVPVFRADDAGRALLSDEEIVRLLTLRFGKGILRGSNINRQELAKIVFADANELAYLNSIVHPAVKHAFRRWLGSQKAPYIIHEAAILFESGFNRMMDRVIFVDCPEQVALERVMKRDRIPLEEVRKRASFQWPREKKSSVSDFILINDGKHALIPQVLALHSRIIEEANI